MSAVRGFLGVLTCALLVAGCAQATADSGTVTCSSLFDRVLERERQDDTSGAINAELDTLGDHCPSEYQLFVDYVSGKGTRPGLEPCSEHAPYLEPRAIQLLREDGYCTGNSEEEPPGDPEESQPWGGIAWSDAQRHVGTVQRVCGPLAGIGSSTDDVFLNIGRDYPDPDRFTIVIWDIGGVEPVAAGTTVCTTGQVTLYEGVPQIQLRSTSDVELYE